MEVCPHSAPASLQTCAAALSEGLPCSSTPPMQHTQRGDRRRSQEGDGAGSDEL